MFFKVMLLGLCLWVNALQAATLEVEGAFVYQRISPTERYQLFVAASGQLYYYNSRLGVSYWADEPVPSQLIQKYKAAYSEWTIAMPPIVRKIIGYYVPTPRGFVEGIPEAHANSQVEKNGYHERINHTIKPARPRADAHGRYKVKEWGHADCIREERKAVQNGTRFDVECQSLMGVELKRPQQIADNVTYRNGKVFSYSLADDPAGKYAVQVKGTGVEFDLREILKLIPAAKVALGGSHSTNSGVARVIGTEKTDGSHQAKLVEVSLNGAVGSAQKIGRTSESIGNTADFRAYVKVGATAAETCVVGVLGFMAPETASLGRGYFPCEYLNNSSPRFRSSHWEMGAQGQIAADRKINSLLNHMPSCKDISQDQLRADALRFPEWISPTESLTGDGYWFLDYCDANGQPNYSKYDFNRYAD